MDRRDDIPYVRRRLGALVIVAVVLALGLLLWWRGAAWFSIHITGDGASTGIFFVGVPAFVSYIVYRILEGVRGE